MMPRIKVRSFLKVCLMLASTCSLPACVSIQSAVFDNPLEDAGKVCLKYVHIAKNLAQSTGFGVSESSEITFLETERPFEFMEPLKLNKLTYQRLLQGLYSDLKEAQYEIQWEQPYFLAVIDNLNAMGVVCNAASKGVEGQFFSQQPRVSTASVLVLYASNLHLAEAADRSIGTEIIPRAGELDFFQRFYPSSISTITENYAEFLVEGENEGANLTFSVADREVTETLADAFRLNLEFFADRLQRRERLQSEKVKELEDIIFFVRTLEVENLDAMRLADIKKRISDLVRSDVKVAVDPIENRTIAIVGALTRLTAFFRQGRPEFATRLFGLVEDKTLIEESKYFLDLAKQ